jgi:hypothetical protein
MRLETEHPNKVHDLSGLRLRWDVLGPVLVFFVFALALAIVNRHIIANAHFEAGDLAANSLLIQDAKSLKLFKGNYSRIGFNHPGPAILYVLALGELLFYDWTGIAPSPFAGQLLAITFYSAFWITLAGAFFKKLSRSYLATALLLITFLSVTAFSQYQVFAGAWFPHLYYFPFAVFTLAIARFACGRSDSLLPLAISCGFLINGHVSFVAITALMLAGALLANQALSRTVLKRTCPSWLSWNTLYANRRALLTAFAASMAFLAPLAIETIVHFPGPVATYINYSSGQTRNGLRESLQFVGSYWAKGPLSLTSVWIILLSGFLYVCAKGEEYFEDVLGLLTALVLATAGLLFYARMGIDDLSYQYLGLFYYSAPAIAAAAAAYCVYARIHPPGKTVLTCIAVAIGLGLTYTKVRQPPDYVEAYNQPEIPRLFQKMSGLGRLPLVLDRDLTPNWPIMVGVEAYAKRKGVELFCVNRGWHILFTDKARCTESAVRTGNRFIVTSSSASNTTEWKPSLDYLGLSFYRVESLPAISTQQALPVGSNRFFFANYVLGNGWSAVETDFVWSLGRESELSLKIDPHTVKRINLDLSAFLPRPDSVQQLSVKLNNVAVAQFTFTADAPRKACPINIPENSNELIDVKLVVSNPSSPKAEHLSGDPRMLGIALHGINAE